MKKIKENELEYRTELKKVWKDDAHMVDYCVSDTSVIVKSDGLLIPIEKQRIKKDFCFGYSSCGQGQSYGEAAKEEKKFGEKQFVAENLHPLSESIRLLKGIDDYGEEDWRELWLYPHYPDFDTNLWQWSRVDNKDALRLVTCGWQRAQKMSEETRQALLKAYELEFDKFEKRLHTWWKRYGATKVHTWTYWVDE